MTKSKWQRWITAVLVAALMVTSLASLALAADETAPAGQVQATEVTGTIPGGQFAKIYLGLTPTTPPTDVTLVGEWDRSNPDGNGLGYFVLTPQGMTRVQAGEQPRNNNVASGHQSFFLNGPNTTQGAQFRATGSDYSVIVFNDSATDASFKLTATNAVLTDDSNQVKAVGAAATEQATATAAATAAAPAATQVTTATTAAAPAATVAAAATPAATAAATAAAPAGPVKSQTMEGELPVQDAQHLLGLEPSIKDGEIKLTLTFDPQDSSELARRLNFWVLNDEGFKRYLAGESPSTLAVAAGSREDVTGGATNVRTAAFKASGFGPYTVIVYNNSRVPATYSLTADGGILSDDSGQTLTAKQAAGVAATTATTGTTSAAAPAVAATTATTTTTAAATTTSGVAGKPGGAYTVKAGDTLAIIARDIYGDYRVYTQICAFNGIKDCNVIEVGQVIKLPTEDQIKSGATAPAATTSATPAATAAAAATTAVTTTAAVTTTSAVTTTAPAASAAVTSTAPVTSTSAATSTTSSAATTAGTAKSASGTIIDVAKANGNFTVLLNALQQAGLDQALAGGGPFTVFAPTDAAFQSLLSENNLTQDQLLKAKELADILKYHVLSSKVLAADITNGMKANTLEGKPVTFKVENGKIYINGAEIVTTDIPAGNGVIQAISAVILPPTQ